MEENGIILIDSSDEEGLPCKIRKISSKKSTSTQKERVDDVVIVDDTIMDKNKYTTCINGQNVSSTIRQKSSDKCVKRIELTSLNDTNNIEHNKLVSTEFTPEPIVDTDENNAPESKYLNCDIGDSGSITLNRIPSTSSADVSQNILSPEFEAFLKACVSSDYDIKYKNMIMKKISSIRCKYINADINFVQSQKFIKYLINTTEKVQQKPSDAIIIFNEVYRELESKKKRDVNFTEREERHLKKLYNALKKVHKKIKYLENETVDFEQDSNSSYIMLERYKDRLCIIHKKICSFTKENFYSGRQLFRNLDFSSSKHSEINRAIDKLYNKKKTFPSYYEVDNRIRKCVKQHNIHLSEEALNKEVRSVFTAVGNVLQRRRKLELYESLTYFVEESQGDPAEEDPEFEALLQGRQIENEKKIDDILQKYTECQEKDEEPEVSPDSDDSHHVSEDSDS